MSPQTGGGVSGRVPPKAAFLSVAELGSGVWGRLEGLKAQDGWRRTGLAMYRTQDGVCVWEGGECGVTAPLLVR